MPKAQEWLNKNYPRETRENITRIKAENLQGSLRLENFPNLESFKFCSCSKITSLEIVNCPKLDFVDCSSSKITELNISGCPNLRILNCSNNLLTKLDLNQNTNLKELYACDNNFSQQGLNFLSHLINLERLELRNYEPERISKGIYNRFAGSLEPLKNLTKLESLRIDNTDITNKSKKTDHFF